jgi:tetrahydromethanopterin S-methyltransferase subunit B
MKVPVFIRYSKLEGVCDCDEQEGVVCDDFKGSVDVDVSDIQLNHNDLEKLVNEYLDEIADILMADRHLLDELLRKLKINLNTC